MKTLKIISFIKVYALATFFGAGIGNLNFDSSLSQEIEYIKSIKASDDSILNKIKQAHFGYLKLQITEGESNFSTDFYFNSNATAGLDPGYDAAIYGGSLQDFSIYSYLVQNNDGTAFAIQALSDTDMQNVTVPLGVNASQGQEVTISIFETDIPDSIDVFLEDKLNNSLTLLNTSDYIFTALSDLTGSGRFFLRFQSNALSIIEPVKNDLHITYNNNEKAITINGQLTSKTKMTLYDINGKVMSTRILETSSTNQSVDVAHLSTGIFVIELTSNTSEKRVEKLMIR